MSTTAGRIEIFFARLFGRRIVITSEGVTIVSYEWRGRRYITSMEVVS